MKKIFSLVLAFVLMFSICVPVFAGTLNAGAPVGSTPVRVDGTTLGASFTVTIPATNKIPWGQVETSVEYSISSQLATGKFVKVSVAADGIMKNNDNTATLAYSLKSGTTSYTTTESVILPENAEESSVVVVIPTENWKKASIDNYEGTLTFTAELV